MTDEPRPSFYDALATQYRAVSVGRVFTVLTTPKVRQYILYKEYLQRLQKALQEPDLMVRSACLAVLLEVILGRDGAANLLPEEVVNVILISTELYEDPPLMEWQKPIAAGEKPKRDSIIDDNLNYDGRVVAHTIALLGRAFGWSSKHVLDEMTMYELGIYAQEAMLLEHQEQEWDYLLSQIGFKKVGDEFIKQSLPSLPWVKKRITHDARSLTPVPARYLPGGDVEIYKPGGELLERRPAEGKVQGLRVNPETGKVEVYDVQ